MLVLKGLVDSLVEVTVVDLVGLETWKRGGNLGQFTAQVHALLVSALGSGRQGSEFGVNLVQELGQLAVVESAGVILVVLLEEPIQATEMVRGLREAFPNPSGEFSPFGKSEVHFLGVAAFLPGNGAEEPDDVVCDVVLDCCAIADCVDVAQGCANHAEMGVGLEGVFVVLAFQSARERFANRGSS